MPAGIVGLGSALPERVVPNAEITPAIGVDDDWIVRRTGIRERRYAEPGARARRAGRGGRPAPRWPTPASTGAQVDLVLVASCSQDSVMPNAAPQVAHAIGAERAGAFDVGSACTGFLAALAAARGMLASRRRAARARDRRRDHVAPRRPRRPQHGGAVRRRRRRDRLHAPARAGDIGPVVLGADGAHAELIVADRATQLLAMDGHETFKQAVRRLAEASTPRRARRRASRSTTSTSSSTTRPTRGSSRRSPSGSALEPDKRRRRIATLGNTSAASVPLALERARRDGRLAPGMRVLLAAAGSGFTWGASVVEWGLRVSAHAGRAPARW